LTINEALRAKIRGIEQGSNSNGRDTCKRKGKIMKIQWGIVWSIIVAMLIMGVISAVAAGWRRVD